MKAKIKILISAAALMALGGFANIAYAQSPLRVSFEPDPLFSVSNFMPGDYREASVTVGNGSDAAQKAYLEAVNVSNSDHLANQIRFEIFEDSNQIYDGHLEDFLNAGPVLLSQIGAGSSKTYRLKASFLGGAGNDYQDKSLGFDICVGFSGGAADCTGDVAVSGEAGLGGGGGSSGGSHRLVISGESASDVAVGDSGLSAPGYAVITWTTNIPATSQVIYGPAAQSPFDFDINNPPNFGYPFATEEDMSKTTSHSVTLTGLVPGETYRYRVVSRASPPSISSEREFSVPSRPISSRYLSALGEGEGWSAVSASAGSSSSSPQGKAQEWRSAAGNLAAAFTAGGGLPRYFLLIFALLLIAYLVRKSIFKSD